MNVEYSKLRPKDLVGRRQKNSIAYIGLGILEWHGLHNPLGLDGEKAHEIARYLAKRLGGVVMPPQFWGDNRDEICELVFTPEKLDILPKGSKDHTMDICRNMKLDKQSFISDSKRSLKNGGWRLWIELMVHTFFQIQSLGFDRIIPIPGHYPLFSPLESAIEDYYDKGGTSDVFVLKDTMFDTDSLSGDHAAKFETSLMLALNEKLVDINCLDKDLSKDNIGVLGDDPRIYASKEFGIEILDKFEKIIKEYLHNYNI